LHGIVTYAGKMKISKKMNKRIKILDRNAHSQLDVSVF